MHGCPKKEKRLRLLLEAYSTTGTTLAFSLLRILINQLNDRFVKPELTVNHLPLSLSAVQKKRDLV